MKKAGKNTYIPSSAVTVGAWQAIVGQKEKEGPLGKYFDLYSNDEYFGQETYEKAEAQMQKEAMNRVFEKANLRDEDVDFIFAGDLLNQCVSSAYGSRDRGAGYFGLYGACSTVIEAAIIAAMTIDGSFAKRAVAITSSHFCTAERQYRYPLNYGSVRPPSAQWTVTGAGALVLDCRAKPLARVELGTVGRVIDYDVPDANHMGAAMAPAAADTLLTHFEDSGRGPSDYDLIATGDLGVIGRGLLIELMKKRGMPLIEERYIDCGAQMFSPDQDVHAGGSGCACLASVFSAVLLGKLSARELKRILIIGTGALLSPVSALQGESIPSIAHALSIECP